jgi:broad specificity phosphatase PhoE
MKVYLVRHGETDANSKNLAQDEQGHLSIVGEKQAEFLAHRLGKLPISKIISSPYERTRQTTAIINKTLHKEVLFSDLFIERRDPSGMVGKSLDDPKIKAIIQELRKNRHIKDWHYSDEENFYDIKDRAEKALAYLISLQTDNVLVVTHSGIMRVLLASMIFGETLTAAMYSRMFSFRTINTGITLVEYEQIDVPDLSNWKVMSWNDHAHLG